MKKRRSTAIEDAKPMARVKQESKNWATAGQDLVGQNTRGMVMQEVPSRAVFNTRGDRFYTESEPVMTQSRAIPNRGTTRGMVKSAKCPDCGGKADKSGKCKCGAMKKQWVPDKERPGIPRITATYGDDAKRHAKAWAASADAIASYPRTPTTFFVVGQNPKNGLIEGKHSMKPKASPSRRSSMTKGADCPNCGKSMSKNMCKCGGMGKMMAKKVPNTPLRRARQHAQMWADNANDMATANAKSPMVIEQTPRGNIMGRATSAKPASSKGSATTKAMPMPMSGKMPMPSMPKPMSMPRPMPKPMSMPRSMGMGKGQGAYIDGDKAPELHPNKMNKKLVMFNTRKGMHMGKAQGAYIAGKKAPEQHPTKTKRGR